MAIANTTNLAHTVAQLITDYLGPSVPRVGPKAPGTGGSSLNGKVVATLAAMRDRLDTDAATFNSRREVLAWQLREAIRTEFYAIRYPAVPSPKILQLVTATEALLTEFGPQRPLYFPGARVAVPTEVGTHRAATTLQIRFKPVNGVTVTEVLLHLDGPRGGTFQFVPSTILMSLSACVPIRNPVLTSDARRAAGQARPVAPRGRRAAGTSNGARRGSRPRAKESKIATAAAKVPMTNLPAAFLPHALRSSSPPPRKRLRRDVKAPVSMTTGSVRRTLDLWNEMSDTLDTNVSVEKQDKVVENTLAISRLIGRRRNMNVGGVVEYCVKWSGAPLEAASWESRDALMTDVPGLVLAFDMGHPGEPVQCSTEVDDEELNEADAPINDVAVESVAPKSLDPLLDDTTNIPIPLYLDTPLVELQFAGMELHVRRGGGYCLFSSNEDASMDRKKRMLYFRRENPEAFAKIFANSSPEYRPESKMVVESKPYANGALPANGGLMPILQQSLESHKTGNRRPILFPRILGEAIPRDIAPPVPAKEIIRAPASWESYLMSLGMACKNWERELLPEMPTASERVMSFVETAAKAIEETRKKVRYERDRSKRIEVSIYTGSYARPRKGKAATPDGVQEKTENVEKGGEGEQIETIIDGEPKSLLSDSNDVFRAALELAREEAKNNAMEKMTINDKSSSGTKKDREYDFVWGCWRPASVK